MRLGFAGDVIGAHLYQRHSAAVAELAEGEAIDGDAAVLQTLVIEPAIERLRARGGDVQVFVNVIFKPRPIDAVRRVVDVHILDEHRGQLRAQCVMSLPQL